MRRLLPTNHTHIQKLRLRYPNDEKKVKRMSLVEATLFKQIDELYERKIQNKTL